MRVKSKTDRVSIFIKKDGYGRNTKYPWNISSLVCLIAGCFRYAAAQTFDANVLTMGGRILGAAVAAAIVKEWMQTEFESGGRHSRRVDKITRIEREKGSG